LQIISFYNKFYNFLKINMVYIVHKFIWNIIINKLKYINYSKNLFLASWTLILHFQPLINTILMKIVKTRQSSNKLLILKIIPTNTAFLSFIFISIKFILRKSVYLKTSQAHFSLIFQIVIYFYWRILIKMNSWMLFMMIHIKHLDYLFLFKNLLL